jgi:hypothetical protein
MTDATDLTPIREAVRGCVLISPANIGVASIASAPTRLNSSRR